MELPASVILLTPIFEEHYNKFKTLITSESNSLYALYSDSITRNPIFKWVKKPPQQIINIPELHCLLMNFIPTSLTYPFKVAKISLLKFLFDLYKDIYEKIWKQQAIAWRQFKKSWGITKKSFTNYRRNYHQETAQRLRQTDYNNINHINGYHCPLNNSRWRVENNNLWIYLTSSNFLHNLPWLSSLNDDLSNFHLTIYFYFTYKPDGH